MQRLVRSNTFIFFVIVLIHVAYKTLYLGEAGYWHDEAFSLYFSQQHWGHLKHISEWDINPPLYYYFLWIWRNLFGVGEFAVRFSSVLFSALSAGMLFLICARHFNRRAGIITVLLFSISSEMYFYAHEARPYSLILFFVLCSTWFFFELLRSPGWVSVIMLGLLNFALIYTHYVSGMILLVQTFVVLLFRNKTLLKYFGAAMAVTVVIALLRFTKKTIALVLHNEKSSFWIQKPTLHDLADTFYGFFNGPDLFYIFLFAAFVSLVYLLRNKEWTPLWAAHRAKFVYIIAAGVGAIVICFLVSLFMPLFVRRYLLFTAPFIYMLLGWFISICNREVRYPVLAIAGVFMFFSVMRIDFHTPRSMDYKHAMSVIKAYRNSGMPVLVETPDVAALFAYYYQRDMFEDYEGMQGKLHDDKIFVVGNSEDARNAGLDRYPGFILTQTFQEVNPGDKSLMDYLNTHYKLRKVFTQYRGIVINFYSKY